MVQNTIKRRKWPWRWLIAGIAIALLIFFLITGKEKIAKEKAGNEKAANITGIKEKDTTVKTFVNFIKENSTHKMNSGHGFTSEALTKLADAVQAMVHEVNYNPGIDLDKVKEYAKKITEDPMSDTHADNIREAANMVTDALQGMQLALYPGLDNEVTALRNASASINPNILALDQKEVINSFFDKAADLLTKMNNAT